MFFKFDQKIYKNFGTSIGSSLSPIIADL